MNSIDLTPNESETLNVHMFQSENTSYKASQAPNDEEEDDNIDSTEPSIREQQRDEERDQEHHYEG